MADGTVQIQPDSTGKKIDTSEITVGANTVERQRMVIADPATAANLATVSAAGALKVDPSAVTQPVSLASVPTHAVTISGNVPMLGVTNEVTFSTTTAQAVASTDCTAYRWASVHIVSQGTSSSIAFQGSNDNINWVSVALSGANGQAALASTAASGLIYQGAITFRYFRLSVTGISAGTTAGVVEFFSVPPSNAFITLATSAATIGSVKLTDGTNTPTVKAASTAPVATDPALVVAVSPNTPTLPVSLASVPTHAVQGPTSSGSAPTSPPLLIGGSDGSLVRTLRTDTQGNLLGKVWDGSNAANVLTTSSDGVATSNNGLVSAGMTYGYNGTSWDRVLAVPTGSNPALSAKGSVVVTPALVGSSKTYAGFQPDKVLVTDLINPSTGTNLIIGAPGYFITSITVMIDPTSGSGNNLLYFNDSSFGNIWAVRFSLPTTRPSTPTATWMSFTTPPGYFFKNATSNSNLGYSLFAAISGAMTLTITYGITPVLY